MVLKLFLFGKCFLKRSNVTVHHVKQTKIELLSYPFLRVPPDPTWQPRAYFNKHWARPMVLILVRHHHLEEALNHR